MLAKGSAVVIASNFPGPMAGTGPRESALHVLFNEHLAQPLDDDEPLESSSGDSHIAPEFRRPAPRGAVLISIGILMAIAIHVVPAVLGLPLMASLISALEVGRKPVPADEIDAETKQFFSKMPESEELDIDDSAGDSESGQR